MRFILILFLVYLFWQVFKFVFRLAFRYWLKKNGGRFYYHSSRGSGFAGHRYRPDPGEIHVDTPFQPQRKTSGGSGKQVGEYIEFEEIK